MVSVITLAESISRLSDYCLNLLKSHELHFCFHANRALNTLVFQIISFGNGIVQSFLWIFFVYVLSIFVKFQLSKEF